MLGEKIWKSDLNMKVLLFYDKIEIIESSFRKKDGSLDDLELGVQVDHSLNKIGDDKFELTSYN